MFRIIVVLVLVFSLSFGFFQVLIPVGMQLLRTVAPTLVRRVTVRYGLKAIKDRIASNIKNIAFKEYKNIIDKRTNILTKLKRLNDSPIGKTWDIYSNTDTAIEAIKKLIIIGGPLGVATSPLIADEIKNNFEKLKELREKLKSADEKQVVKIEEDIKILQAQNNKIMDKISQNDQKIMALQKEQDILGKNVVQNRYDLKMLNQKFGLLENKVQDLTTLIEKNSEEIKKLKDNFFVTGLEQLNLYYETNNYEYLITARNNFHLFKNIEDKKFIKYLSQQFYLLVISEEYIYNVKNNKQQFDKIKAKRDIKNNFNNLFNNIPKKVEYLPILITSYTSILDILNKEDKSNYLKKIQNFYSTIINDLIKNKKFNQAVAIAEEFKSFNEDQASKLLKEAQENRENNFEKYKREIEKGKIDKILSENQNTKLVEFAVKKMSRDKNYPAALKLLNNNLFEDRDFRSKAYLNIYYVMGNDKKLKEFKQLILSSNIYSEEVKKYARERFK